MSTTNDKKEKEIAKKIELDEKKSLKNVFSSIKVNNPLPINCAILSLL